MGAPALDDLPLAFRRHLSERDLNKNSTLQSFDSIRTQLRILDNHRDSIDSILDVGCNRGGFVTALGDHLDADTVYGIDIDKNMREQASERGVSTFGIDVETEPIPLSDDSIDLVLSFGLVEHLRYYDNLFEQVNRVLRDGWFWIATPNLASWVNRFALLSGHQPRNVEVSREYTPGVLPIYKRPQPINHVHAPTYAALIELLEHYKFEPRTSVPLYPYQRSMTAKLLDTLFSVRLSWSRRVSVLASQR
ncbi:class I SAM-dependent methyltransferase [Natronosalvus amylolyticus]|uniref:class I SAM-dependent methyltransferase n=1 Tax=Natronosalvus amylolyticus TaxID=2961994 RepID=UPI0020C9E2FC|nr:class I SAM-dependent methyltransferase [Natronosalvus amylolyticus]